MKFLLHGRAGKYLLREELLAPTLEKAVEKAKRRVEECLKKDERFGRIDVELHLSLPPVWERTNHREGTMSHNGLLDLVAEDPSVA